MTAAALDQDDQRIGEVARSRASAPRKYELSVGADGNGEQPNAEAYRLKRREKWMVLEFIPQILKQSPHLSAAPGQC